MSTLHRSAVTLCALPMQIAVCLLIFLAPWSGAAAQRLIISAPSVIEVEPSTETPLPIRVLPENAVPRRAMLLIHGLPATVALSEGRLFDSGVWAIRVADLPRLRLASPAEAGSRSLLTLSAMSLDGSVLAKATASLVVVTPRPAVAEARRTAPNTRPTVVVITPKPEETPRAAEPARKTLVRKALTPEEMKRVDMYMSKAAENWKNANVNVARLFYKRAADLGWPPAALALGSTYDAAELESVGAIGGIQPNAELAIHWYKKAQELGAPEAENRLSRLSSR